MRWLLVTLLLVSAMLAHTIAEASTGGGEGGAGMWDANSPKTLLQRPKESFPSPVGASASTDGGEALYSSAVRVPNETSEVSGFNSPTRLSPSSLGATCAGDLNADSYADGTDITLLAGQFGHAIPPAPAAYDLALPPDGYVDGTDITWLAGLFGQHCLGTLTADTGPSGAVTEGVPQPAIWGCTVSMPIWANNGAGVPMPGYVAIGSGWGGRTLCDGDTRTLYYTSCNFALQSRPLDRPWSTIAVTGNPTMLGLFCYSQGQGAGYIPCNTQIVGYMEHHIWDVFDGTQYHNEAHYIMGDGGFGINVPC